MCEIPYSKIISCFFPDRMTMSRTRWAIARSTRTTGARSTIGRATRSKTTAVRTTYLRSRPNKKTIANKDKIQEKRKKRINSKYLLSTTGWWSSELDRPYGNITFVLEWVLSQILPVWMFMRCERNKCFDPKWNAAFWSFRQIEISPNEIWSMLAKFRLWILMYNG